MKNTIKKMLNAIGIEIISASHYKELIRPKQQQPISQYNKNNLLHNFYSIIKSQGFEPKCIYDIGANKGTWSKECMAFFPEAEFILFEPQIRLKEDIRSLLRDKHYQLFSVGVGNQNAELSFTLHEWDDSCSFRFSAEDAQNRGFPQVTVPIVKLDDFIENQNLLKPDLLKIDAEGLDLEVLEGATKTLMQNTEVVLVEVGVMCKELKNSTLEVLKKMDEMGFRFFEITDLNRPFDNKVLWLCELAFIKKGGLLDKNYKTIRK